VLHERLLAADILQRIGDHVINLAALLAAGEVVLAAAGSSFSCDNR
jgi:hypothetical protein